MFSLKGEIVRDAARDFARDWQDGVELIPDTEIPKKDLNPALITSNSIPPSRSTKRTAVVDTTGKRQRRNARPDPSGNGSMIRRAKTIQISNAYFILHPALLAELKLAMKRGTPNRYSHHISDSFAAEDEILLPAVARSFVDLLTPANKVDPKYVAPRNYSQRVRVLHSKYLVARRQVWVDRLL